MLERIKNIIKKNPWIVPIYMQVGKIIFGILGLFCPIKENRAVFVTFGGKGFNDSPRAIYEEMCRREEYKDWEFIWAFVEPDKFEVKRGKKIKIDSFWYYKMILSSKLWITNASIDRGMPIKKKETLEINTWHGTPLKRICGEEKEGGLMSHVKKVKKDDSNILYCSQSQYDREIFSRIFQTNIDNILMCDLPRNDELLKYTRKDIDEIKGSLKIPEEKKVILYVPTYREYARNEENECFFCPPLDLKKWERELGTEYVFLFRAHYEIKKAMNLEENHFVRDVSSYGNLNDLYVVADILISDYSSCFFDYAILDKPMLCFAYDLEEYEEKRGLYLELEETLPCPVDKMEDEVIERISTMKFDEYSGKAREFHCEYAPYAGNATESNGRITETFKVK